MSNSPSGHSRDRGKPGRSRWYLPDVAEGVLHRAGHAAGAEQQHHDADDQGQAGAGDRAEVDRSAADHRVLRERRVQQVGAQLGVVLQRHVQDRDEDQQQREHREERVVGDERGEVPGLVVLELLPDRHRERQRRPPLLEVVDRAPGSRERVHTPRSTRSPGRRDPNGRFAAMAQNLGNDPNGLANSRPTPPASPPYCASPFDGQAYDFRREAK